MDPLTWAADDNIYAGAGGNMCSLMNYWKVTGHPNQHHSRMCFMTYFPKPGPGYEAGRRQER